MKTLLIPSTSSTTATASTPQGVAAVQHHHNSELVAATLRARPVAPRASADAQAARSAYTVLPSGLVILRSEYDAESFFDNYDRG